jgi:hypothetical protein
VGECPPFEVDMPTNEMVHTRLIPGINYVCQNMRGLIEDPRCQTLMAEKIYMNMTSFFMGVPTLPDH